MAKKQKKVVIGRRRRIGTPLRSRGRGYPAPSLRSPSSKKKQ